MGVRNEVGVTQGLRLALAFGHHGMSPSHGGVAGTYFRVRDSTRSNSRSEERRVGKECSS